VCVRVFEYACECYYAIADQISKWLVVVCELISCVFVVFVCRYVHVCVFV
jgi:hypothetical protein